MMKILTVTLTLMLLIGCGSEALLPAEPAPLFATKTGAKCPKDLRSLAITCRGDVAAKIELDASGAPSSVGSITTCQNKKVTWTYKNGFPGGDAPPFAILFKPSDFPGNANSVKVWSKPVDSDKNQEFTLQTKRLGEGDECINYDIYIPEKGILDPVFIIDR